MVYPKDRIPELISWYEVKQAGPIDSLMEEFADVNGRLRYAIFPSVLQHIGTTSSKGEVGHSMGHIWNFGFEKNIANELRREHNQVIGL